MTLLTDKVGVIGCGQAGLALASYFSKKGCLVTLYSHPQHINNFNLFQNSRYVQTEGLYQGKFKINCYTNDIEKLLKNNRLIFLMLPSYMHDDVFELMIPFLKQSHTLVNVTGNFSSLFFLKKLDRLNLKDQPIIADINLSPFACRLEKNTRTVNIIGLKNKLHLSSNNFDNTNYVIGSLKNIFPSDLLPAKNLIEVGLRNVNGICHPGILLLNAGRIGKDDFYFNRDGITPEISSVLESVESERLEIANRLNIQLTPFLETMNGFYGEKFDSIFEFFKNTTTLNSLKLCPKSLNNRFIEEDIPYVLVPWLSLAKLSGYYANAIETLINLSSLLLKKDYKNLGRNLEILDSTP